jgi:hypothetical protein
MNAVERLWRALAAGDWESARSQFRLNASIEWAHRSELLSAEEYLARMRARSAEGIDVARVVSEGRFVAVEARAGATRCAAFYDLHDGLITNGVEYWVGEGA